MAGSSMPILLAVRNPRILFQRRFIAAHRARSSARSQDVDPERVEHRKSGIIALVRLLASRRTPGCPGFNSRRARQHTRIFLVVIVLLGWFCWQGWKARLVRTFVAD